MSLFLCYNKIGDNMVDNSGFEHRKEYYNKIYNAKLKRIEELRNTLSNPDNNLSERALEVYYRRLNDSVSQSRSLKSQVDYVRLNYEEDYNERLNLSRSYPPLIKELVKDGVPLVFHGNRHLGVVQDIIRSGGLFTPEEREVSMTSFASQIDVTYKDDMRVSLEFAEPGLGSYLPYGAIFAFFPKEEEFDNVLRTGESSEVFGGVEGVNFLEEPDRLVAIITTRENIDIIKSVCEEVGIDSDKVVTHQEFLDLAPNVSYGYTK